MERRRITKYKAVKTVVDGIKFDSKKESERYKKLKEMEQNGKIKNLQLQVPFVIIPKSAHGRAIKYIPDFVYYIGDEMIVEDVKGFKTDVYKLKKRLVAEVYGVEVKEI